MFDDHEALTRARNAYAYAPLRLVRSESAGAQAALWDMPVQFAGPLEGQASAFASWPSWDLDQHHAGLLRSQNNDDVLLGVASVTFWGFAQGRGGRLTTARALARAKNIAGLGQHKADEASTIVDKVRIFSAHLDRGDRQAAINEAMSLQHHGLAFASKLLAFASPETACVYDEVISLRLGASDDNRLRALHVSTAGKHRLAEKASAYAGWAQLCASKASDLNRDGRLWLDWDGSERSWRAVDVERAYFGLGRPSAPSGELTVAERRA
ncbi:hypothetical protein RM53_14930 [Brevundimonas nasdae]|uniref:Uncharacterized protein n=1 Tax=Brevundimonas nasdae TaxID=172043 RepID=A0A0B4CN58_9CAUL|nr:hypothetical protein [Brevundimonas nasdae]KIC55856.1 hypothetical protein RM53_14930 [Brevundimonas nasdae]